MHHIEEPYNEEIKQAVYIEYVCDIFGINHYSPGKQLMAHNNQEVIFYKREDHQMND